MWSVALALSIQLSLVPGGFAGEFGLGPSPVSSEQEQSDSGVVVWGEISTGYSAMSNWTVELIPRGGGTPQTTAVQVNGSFEFRGVTPGLHEVRVSDGRGKLVYDEVVSIRANEMLSIRPRLDEPAQSAKGELISVAQLRHKFRVRPR